MAFNDFFLEKEVFETLTRGPPLGSSQKKATLSAKCCVTASCTTQTYSAEAEVTAKKRPCFKWPSVVRKALLSGFIDFGFRKKKTCNSLFRQFTDLRFFKNLVAKLLGFFERGKEKRDERGGSDSFSGRRKLFWGNDDHLKSRAALSFQLDLLVLQ